MTNLPSFTTPPSIPARTPRLPRAVVALGWVSFLTDAASDMIYPLVPAFLLSIGGGAAALGWLEGVAEAVSAALKLVSGKASDHAARRKPLIALGYGTSALARPLYAIATHPAHAIVIRALDRVGKGLRGPPRDAMLAAMTPAAQRGHAFGFHRMMDNLGGAAGPILAFLLLRLLDLPVRRVFELSIVPGALSVLAVLLFVRGEPSPSTRVGTPGSQVASTRVGTPGSPVPSGAGTPDSVATAPLVSGDGVRGGVSIPWRGPLGRYYVALALFGLAGSGDLFLMRRLTDLGLDLALVPVAWVSLQLCKGALNVPGGRAADRFGRRRVLAMAWGLYAVTYAGFGFAGTWAAAWGLLAIYAVHYGLAEGAQRALLSDYTPDEARGSVYGVQLALEGGTGLVANIAFGLAYERFGAEAAFAAAGVLALSAAATLGWLVPDPRPALAAPAMP